ncbi:hypothetical protein [Entomospira culicis]|nr:hypothetical protein [Entomospira culicis]WDI37123.1 hypothetical protein PVA46_07330 [Entomospira culicis]WDI38752.1 hypothetical protein PVA47_07340 [Entomospira culicis]
MSINIYGNVYGIDDLERVIESAIHKAENKLMRSVSFGLDSGYEV